jgi:hypothetical protein
MSLERVSEASLRDVRWSSISLQFYSNYCLRLEAYYCFEASCSRSSSTALATAKTSWPLCTSDRMQSMQRTFLSKVQKASSFLVGCCVQNENVCTILADTWPFGFWICDEMFGPLVYIVWGWPWVVVTAFIFRSAIFLGKLWMLCPSFIVLHSWHSIWMREDLLGFD